jgi:hypothetical protein
MKQEHPAGKLTKFASIVTAPLSASARPETVAPVPSVMLAVAIMLPENEVAVPRVTELPTIQKTLQALPPLMTATEAPEAVVSVLLI